MDHIEYPPLCGEEWFKKHRHDYTMSDIEAQSIEISREDGKSTTRITQGVKKIYVKDIISEVVKRESVS